ncbi:MAG: 2-amino-4-hydroxy-6-hydroxymethyldihydropteridine diphosphokinase [Eubacteriales bacterium]|nr:2-amino-4-hydroxy-6-hydroxymethyldihydropteridine diphosphokinase [Eubacteriales bacterium]
MTPFDTIVLHGLQFNTLIGILPDEQNRPQPITVDLDLCLMPILSCQTDDLDQSISYAAIYDQLFALITKHHVGLVERLAGLIASTLLTDNPLLMAVSVSVFKPQAPLPGPFAKAGVSIYRTRADFNLRTPVDLSIGSNLGDRLALLQQAVAMLAGHPNNHIVATSSVYETTPVGLIEQPDFLNLVVRLETTLDPLMLLSHCQAIERQLGRERVLHGGPRTIDIDILTYGSVQTQSAELVLPHPRLAERDFVLIPRNELNTGSIQATPHVRFSCKLP